MSKRCTRCLEWKPRSGFYRDRSKSDGLKSQCKECRKLYKRDYRARKRARIIVQLKRTYKFVWTKIGDPVPPPQNRPNIDTPGYRRWRASNIERRKEFVNQYLRNWHAQNREESAKWQRENPHVSVANRQQRRADEANVPVSDFRPVEWKWLLNSYEHRCAYCGKSPGKLVPDHVVPLSQGGANTLTNIVPACQPCNSHKGARTPSQAKMAFAIKIHIDNHRIQLNLF